MDKSLIEGLLIGGVEATAAGAAPGYRAIENRDEYAKVVSADPSTGTVRLSRTSGRSPVVSDSASDDRIMR